MTKDKNFDKARGKFSKDVLTTSLPYNEVLNDFYLKVKPIDLICQEKKTVTFFWTFFCNKNQVELGKPRVFRKKLEFFSNSLSFSQIP